MSPASLRARAHQKRSQTYLGVAGVPKGTRTHVPGLPKGACTHVPGLPKGACTPEALPNLPRRRVHTRSAPKPTSALPASLKARAHMSPASLRARAHMSPASLRARAHQKRRQTYLGIASVPKRAPARRANEHQR
ncbi:unnamed protein product, partial [Iphiclides podalirius]